MKLVKERQSRCRNQQVQGPGGRSIGRPTVRSHVRKEKSGDEAGAVVKVFKMCLCVCFSKGFGMYLCVFMHMYVWVEMGYFPATHLGLLVYLQ